MQEENGTYYGPPNLIDFTAISYLVSRSSYVALVHCCGDELANSQHASRNAVNKMKGLNSFSGMCMHGTGVARNFDWEGPKMENFCDIFRWRNDDEITKLML